MPRVAAKFAAPFCEVPTLCNLAATSRFGTQVAKGAVLKRCTVGVCDWRCRCTYPERRPIDDYFFIADAKTDKVVAYPPKLSDDHLILQTTASVPKVVLTVLEKRTGRSL